MTTPDLATVLAERDHALACRERLRQTVAELMDMLNHRKDEDLRHLQRGSAALAALARCRPLITDADVLAAIDAVFRGD